MALPQQQENRAITYLLEYIASSDCTFVINSQRYNGVNTAQQMLSKYRRDRSHVPTGEEFIRRVASRSDTTDTPYMVNCQDSEPETTARWLHRALANFHNQSDPYREQ